MSGPELTFEAQEAREAARRREIDGMTPGEFRKALRGRPMANLMSDITQAVREYDGEGAKRLLHLIPEARWRGFADWQIKKAEATGRQLAEIDYLAREAAALRELEPDA